MKRLPPPLPPDPSDKELIRDRPLSARFHREKHPESLFEPRSARAHYQPSELEIKDLLTEAIKQRQEECHRFRKLRDVIFQLRMTYWQINHCQNEIIRQYDEVINTLGHQICENCKRILKLDHNHLNLEGKYRCHQRTYDDHFMKSSAGRFFPMET